MSPHRIILTLAAALLLILHGAGNAIADEYEDAVKSAYSAWDAAFNNKDADALAAFYTDDAYFLPPTIRSSKARRVSPNSSPVFSRLGSPATSSK
jgi:hypothetical protein